MLTTIIIPTYKEKENITKLLPQIFALPLELEVIIVDDNSPDGTGEAVKKLQKIFPHLHLIARSGKMGLGSAYIEGFKKALSIGAEYVMEMDADFSHDPKDIPKLIQAAQTVDLSIGSRKVAGGKIIGWNWWRHFMSNGAMWFSRLILGLKAKDVTAGFRCYARRIIETIPLNEIKSNGYAFQEEMLYRTQKSGFKIIEIPVTFTDRISGQSKLSKKDIVEFFTTIIKLKFKK